MPYTSLTRFAWLSIAAALITIFLKTVAFLLTGSAGLLSDALESVVNLVAAITALTALHISQRPPDENHAYGHTKAEYFASISEGVLIIIGAITISVFAIQRLITPTAVEIPSLAIIVSLIATGINYYVARQLLQAGKEHRSITLEAEAKHLLTDVWTSLAVVVAVFLVVTTGLIIVDPIIALVVAGNIVVSGIHLIKQSALGFMDTAIDPADITVVKDILSSYCVDGIAYHGLRTRQSASRQFISVHILVPGYWSVKKGHNLLEKIESAIHKKMKKVTIFTHLEPIEDPRSMEDEGIDR